MNRFGVPPSMQILDFNFHNKIVSNLKVDREKRGRPDVVHFALLDATSTPVFEEGKLGAIIHTRDGHSIRIGSNTRLPRTLQRFCGVMAKLITGNYGEEERRLFDVVKSVSLSNLISSLSVNKVISLSSQGTRANLRQLVASQKIGGDLAWIVGGFPHGHFKDEVLEISNEVVSISNRGLPAHVVTARLSYELEVSRIISL